MWPKSVLFVAIVLTCPFLAAEDLRLVDLSFKGADVYLGITVAPDAEGREALAFSLVDQKSGRARRLNHCRYLRHRLDLVASPKSGDDFDRMFLRSGQTPATLEGFYPRLRDLLRRARPECAVPSLQQLKRALR